MRQTVVSLWTDEERAAACEWVRAHGLDPGAILETAPFGRRVHEPGGAPLWTVDEIVRGPDGEFERHWNGQFVMRSVTFAELLPWPLPLAG